MLSIRHLIAPIGVVSCVIVCQVYGLQLEAVKLPKLDLDRGDGARNLWAP